MSDRCNHCDGTGFVNIAEVPEDVRALAEASTGFHEAIISWMEEAEEPHDVKICNCCGDGESEWHGRPGEHDSSTYGKAGGPYEYNGGVPECH